MFNDIEQHLSPLLEDIFRGTMPPQHKLQSIPRDSAALIQSLLNFKLASNPSIWYAPILKDLIPQLQCENTNKFDDLIQELETFFNEQQLSFIKKIAITPDQQANDNEHEVKQQLNQQTVKEPKLDSQEAFDSVLSHIGVQNVNQIIPNKFAVSSVVLMQQPMVYFYLFEKDLSEAYDNFLNFQGSVPLEVLNAFVCPQKLISRLSQQFQEILVEQLTLYPNLKQYYLKLKHELRYKIEILKVCDVSDKDIYTLLFDEQQLFVEEPRYFAFVYQTFQKYLSKSDAKNVRFYSSIAKIVAREKKFVDEPFTNFTCFVDQDLNTFYFNNAKLKQIDQYVLEGDQVPNISQIKPIKTQMVSIQADESLVKTSLELIESSPTQSLVLLFCFEKQVMQWVIHPKEIPQVVQQLTHQGFLIIGAERVVVNQQVFQNPVMIPYNKLEQDSSTAHVFYSGKKQTITLQKPQIQLHLHVEVHYDEKLNQLLFDDLKAYTLLKGRQNTTFQKVGTLDLTLQITTIEEKNVVIKSHLGFDVQQYTLPEYLRQSVKNINVTITYSSFNKSETYTYQKVFNNEGYVQPYVLFFKDAAFVQLFSNMKPLVKVSVLVNIPQLVNQVFTTDQNGSFVVKFSPLYRAGSINLQFEIFGIGQNIIINNQSMKQQQQLPTYYITQGTKEINAPIFTNGGSVVISGEKVQLKNGVLSLTSLNVGEYQIGLLQNKIYNPLFSLVVVNYHVPAPNISLIQQIEETTFVVPQDENVRVSILADTNAISKQLVFQKQVFNPATVYNQKFDQPSILHLTEEQQYISTLQQAFNDKYAQYSVAMNPPGVVLKERKIQFAPCPHPCPPCASQMSCNRMMSQACFMAPGGGMQTREMKCMMSRPRNQCSEEAEIASQKPIYHVVNNPLNFSIADNNVKIEESVSENNTKTIKVISQNCNQIVVTTENTTKVVQLSYQPVTFKDSSKELLKKNSFFKFSTTGTIIASIQELCQLNQLNFSDPIIQIFIQWQSFNEQQKNELLYQNYCYELALFVKFNDRQFFDIYVRKFINSRHCELSAIDYWLLDDQEQFIKKLGTPTSLSYMLYQIQQKQAFLAFKKLVDKIQFTPHQENDYIMNLYNSDPPKSMKQEIMSNLIVHPELVVEQTFFKNSSTDIEIKPQPIYEQLICNDVRKPIFVSDNICEARILIAFLAHMKFYYIQETLETETVFRSNYNKFKLFDVRKQQEVTSFQKDRLYQLIYERQQEDHLPICCEFHGMETKGGNYQNGVLCPFFTSNSNQINIDIYELGTKKVLIGRQEFVLEISQQQVQLEELKKIVQSNQFSPTDILRFPLLSQRQISELLSARKDAIEVCQVLYEGGRLNIELLRKQSPLLLRQFYLRQISSLKDYYAQLFDVTEKHPSVRSRALAFEQNENNHGCVVNVNKELAKCFFSDSFDVLFMYLITTGKYKFAEAIQQRVTVCYRTEPLRQYLKIASRQMKSFDLKPVFHSHTAIQLKRYSSFQVPKGRFNAQIIGDEIIITNPQNLKVELLTSDSKYQSLFGSPKLLGTEPSYKVPLSSCGVHKTVIIRTDYQQLFLENPISSASFECFLNGAVLQAIDRKTQQPVKQCLVELKQNETLLERGFTDFNGCFIVRGSGQVTVYRTVQDVCRLTKAGI